MFAETRPVGTELTYADRRTTLRSEYELILTMRMRLNMKLLLLYASCYLMTLSVTQRPQHRMTGWLLMSTELEGFLKETLVAYSSYSFFVCAEELRNIAFHHCQQTREKKRWSRSMRVNNWSGMGLKGAENTMKTTSVTYKQKWN